MLVEKVGIGGRCDGLAVIGLERGENVVDVVAEVEHEGAVLVGADPVETRQGLHRSKPRQRLVDIHRVQQRLVETGLELLGHHHDLELVGVEACRGLAIAKAVVFDVGPQRATEPHWVGSG